ncbi:MAG: glycosyltransferase [Bacteroidota bacterium]
MKSYRVIHFVTGGGSGSTRVAMALVSGHQKGELFEPFLVFRRKKKRNQALIDEILSQDIKFAEVAEKPKFLTIIQLVKIIKSFKPDIMVSHGYSEHIWGRIAAIIAKVPVIIQVEHNTEKYQPQQYLESRILYNHTNKIVCVSHGVMDYLAKLGFNKERMQVIYNGIPLERFSSLQTVPFINRQPNLVMVARFARQKDHSTLIRAASLLREYSIKVYLVGEGKKNYRQQAENLVKSLNLEEKVFFLGPRSDIPELLSQNQISVLATRYEGFGLVVVEAMAAGCIVIASNVTGVSELVQNGITGFLVPPGEPVALAEKIKYIINNQAACSKIASAGQLYVHQNFGVERMVKEYEQLFLKEINCRKNTV